MAAHRLTFVLLATFCLLAQSKEPMCTAAKTVSYEPTRVELLGSLVVGASRHPNGTKLVYPILRLANPIAVEGETSPPNPINQAETCVREVQLYAPDRKLNRKLLKHRGGYVVVRGTLFYGHTAWHMRKIVMSVVEAKVKNAL
jgi:hypothetical protein